MNRPLLVILGPTAVGKTGLSLALAAALDVEIISADSRLFYRGMDIGTAKPSSAELTFTPHHLIDICTPDQTVSLGDYQRRCYATIDAIHARGRLPILVGGAGQYVRAVVEGWGIPKVPPQPELRMALEKMVSAELHRWLCTLDPAAAEKIHPNNKRRLIRALEVTFVAGRPISHLQRKQAPPYDIFVVGLQGSRDWLYPRIDARVDAMLAAGLIAEVEALRDAGYGRTLPAMSGIGYRQIWEYLAGERPLAEAVEKIKTETHRLVRHQGAWFQSGDERIMWVDADSADFPQSILPTLIEKYQLG